MCVDACDVCPGDCVPTHTEACMNAYSHKRMNEHIPAFMSFESHNSVSVCCAHACVHIQEQTLENWRLDKLTHNLNAKRTLNPHITHTQTPQPPSSPQQDNRMAWFAPRSPERSHHSMDPITMGLSITARRATPSSVRGRSGQVGAMSARRDKERRDGASVANLPTLRTPSSPRISSWL